MLRRLVVLAPVIAACHGGAEARSPEGVARLTLTADDTSLAVNESTALRVTVYDERANVLYSSDGGPVADSVSFAVEPPGVIAVESAIALAVGRATRP